MSLWVTVDEVVKFHGLKQQHLNIKDDTALFEETISKWIIQSEDLIKHYTHNQFVNGVPDAVKNVCLRLVSNMCTLAVLKRETPIIKVNDWTMKAVPSDIFTDDLKEDLEPFILAGDGSSLGSVDVFAITGEDVHKRW